MKAFIKRWLMSVLESEIKAVITKEVKDSEQILRDELSADLPSASEVADEIHASEIAEQISISDVASELNYRELAEELDYSDLANEISNEELASRFDASDIASEIDVDNLIEALVAYRNKERARRRAGK